MRQSTLSQTYVGSGGGGVSSGGGGGGGRWRPGGGVRVSVCFTSIISKQLILCVISVVELAESEEPGKLARLARYASEQTNGLRLSLALS
jgi:hypothetical protein